MLIDLFLQHHRLPPVPEGALAGITAMAAGMGLCTHWDEVHRALYVDSPLHNRIVACAAAVADAPDPLAERVIADLARRIQAAGGLTAHPGDHQAVIAIHFHVSTGRAGPAGEVSLAVWHGWLPRSRRLGRRVAASLVPATGLPVRVGSRWDLWGRQLHIHLSVPTPGACDHLSLRIAEGIWYGVMAFLSRGRGGPPIARAAGAPPVAPLAVPVAPPAQPPAQLPLPPRNPLLPTDHVSFRPIGPGAVTPIPVYVWNWTITPHQWEVIRPQPAPAPGPGPGPAPAPAPASDALPPAETATAAAEPEPHQPADVEEPGVIEEVEQGERGMATDVTDVTQYD